MKSYTFGLILSIAILFLGVFSGYAFHKLTNVNILRTVKVVSESPVYKMTEARVEVVEAVVEKVIAPEKVEKPIPVELKILPTALGIFTTNIMTCLAAGLTPLIPLLYLRHVTPIYLRLLKKRVEGDPWRLYKYATPIGPVTILWFNGLILYMVLELAKGVPFFTIPEAMALTMLGGLGITACLNWDTPESLEKPYEKYFWSIAFYSTMLLIVAAFQEAWMIS